MARSEPRICTWNWFGRPLWEMEPRDADRYLGTVLSKVPSSTRAARARALVTYFDFLEIRYKVALHELTGRVVERPIDEVNRPRMSADTQIRIPPTEAEMEQLFAGWREDLVSCRKFAPSARNYTVARLSADVGLRINESRMLDLTDVHWELGRFGKLNVRRGKGSNRKGPKQRLVPLIQRCRPHADMVHRGRMGPVRRRRQPSRRSAVPVRTSLRQRSWFTLGHQRHAPGPGRRGGAAPSRPGWAGCHRTSCATIAQARSTRPALTSWPSRNGVPVELAEVRAD